MTLKYEFKTKVNPNYKKKDIEKLLKMEQRLAMANSVLGHKKEVADYDELVDTKDNIDGRLNSIRSNLKALTSQPKTLKEIHLKSEKKWTFFKEYINDDCGRTRYESPTEYSVDISVPYNRDVSNAETVKQSIDRAKEEALQELREYRRKSREVRSVTRTYLVEGLPESPEYKVYAGNGFGGPNRKITYRDVLRGTFIEYELPQSKDNYFIHMKGGAFVELQQAKKLRNIFEQKKPLTSEPHVGVEIEYVSKFNKIETARNLLNEGVSQYVCLTTDGSIRAEPDYKHAHELTIVAPETMIHEVMFKVLKAINKDGGSKVGGRCGLHVHLDMRQRDEKKCFTNLSRSQNILYKMNPKSRLDAGDDTNFCRKIDQDDFDKALAHLKTMRSEARYHGINIMALAKHGTIEIRIHSGSTNFEKISNWIKILTSIVNRKDVIEAIPANPIEFCEVFTLDQNILDYINRRMSLFKDKSGKHITVVEAA